MWVEGGQPDGCNQSSPKHILFEVAASVALPLVLPPPYIDPTTPLPGV